MGVEVSRLSNGLTVATETIPNLESVALGVWVKSGARNERDDEHGIAHLLEHMAFKGTKRRSAFQIASEIENVGGEINAATSVETTSFYARVLSDDVPLAVDILSDILQNSEFDPDELAREQHVVLQEIGAAHDTPDDIVFDRFTETAFRHQTLGRSILGTPETVKSFTSRQLHEFMERQYGADRMVVVAAGDIRHDEFVREVEKRLGRFRSKAEAAPPTYAQYVGGDFRENRDLMDAQIVLGFEGRAYHVRDLLFGLCVPLGLFRYWNLRHTCGHGPGRSRQADPGHHPRTGAGGRKDHPGGIGPRPGAISSRPYHVGGEPGQPGLADRPPTPALRPSNSKGRTDGQAGGAHRGPADGSFVATFLDQADTDGCRPSRDAGTL